MTLLRILCLLLCLLPVPGLAQSLRLSGKITDAGGQALPFATVYAESTSRGTTANSEGEYFLNLPAGTYKITFRYVGYGSRTETVALVDRPVVVNVQLAQESLRLNEVTVRPDGKYEDPAYAIIRNAIAKRKFYLAQTGNFACDAYVKGLTRMLKAPRKIMGQDVNIPGVDSSGKGILYLSESVSKLYVQGPKVKEVMVSSKVSGRDNGFSFNTAAGIHEWNFYENLIKTDFNERGFVSPIAQGALLVYEYKLVGTSTENGLQVHKIAVTPKRRTDPAFGGFLYIQEESWRIHATDLVLSRSAGLEVLDSLSIHQVYIPVKPDTWLPGTVEFTFGFDVFGFKANGYFIGSLSGYQTGVPFEKGFFTREVLRVEPQSNKKDPAYWQQVRPVPLTLEETTDYTRKDSLQKVWESKPYMDSLDRRNNRFKPLNVISGYAYRNSYRGWSLNFGSLLNNVQFNTVEGLVLETDVGYSRRDKENRKSFSFSNSLRYGFSGRQFYVRSGVRYQFSPVKVAAVSLFGGRYIGQFNAQEPISYLVNTAYTLLDRRNYLKLYEKRYAELSWRQEVANGVLVNAGLEVARRVPLQNTTDFSLRRIAERPFTPNLPLPVGPDSLGMTAHNANTLRLGVRLRFRQQYMSRPDFKINLDSPFPTLSLQYRRGIPEVLGGATDYDFLRVGLDQEVRLGLAGESRYDVSFGSFLSRNRVQLPDYRHFAGNQTILAVDRLDGFYLLPYYDYSTTGDHWEGHYEHHFNGFLFNKIPLLRRLRWQEVVGAHLLRTPELGNYLELTAGIDQILKIGKVLRVGRLDFAAAFNEGRRVRTGLLFRVAF
jgi:hypothetical protein